jgi:outer membrane protein
MVQRVLSIVMSPATGFNTMRTSDMLNQAPRDARVRRRGRWVWVVLFWSVGLLAPAQSGTAANVAEPLELRLEEAIELALRSNRSIRDAHYAINSSEHGLAAARQAFGIKVRPLSSINYTSSDEREIAVWQVGGSVSRTFETGVSVAVEPSVAKDDGDYDADVGFSITVPLLRGLGSEVVLDEVYANEFTLAAARRQLHRQRVDTVLETVAAVYGLVREEQLIALYRQQLVELGQHLRLTAGKERIGLARSMDVYRVEIRIKETEDSLSLARERADTVADQLKTVLALPLEQQVTVRAPLSYSLITIDLDEAVGVALEQRVEISQGQADIVEAQRKSQVAYHNIMPDLQLEAAYTRGGSFDDDDLSTYDENLLRISLSSSTDLARSTEKAKWEQSRIAVSRRQLQYASLTESIVREVRRVINSLEKSAERIALRRQQIAQATGKFRLAQVKFRHGEADNFDLIESQGQLQQARADLVTDEINYIITGYRLRAALGTLLDRGEEER